MGFSRAELLAELHRRRTAQSVRKSEGRPNDWIPHAPTPKQRAFLGLECLEALYGGAAGGGKSDALLMAALQHVDEPGYAAILFRRTFSELSLPEAIMERSHEWLGPSKAAWNGDTKTWTFPSGATLSFGYLDKARDHERYQSAAFAFVGFDELTHFQERQYRYLFSRARRPAGSRIPVRMRAATNPGSVGHEWVKRRWVIPDVVDFSRVYDHDGRVFLPARRNENPHLDQDSYSRSLAELDSVTRQQLDEGRWIRDTSGLVFRLDEKLNIIDALPHHREDAWKHVLAIDYGNVNATALVALGWHKHDPRLYVVESQKWADLDPEDAAQVVDSWHQRYHFRYIVGDTGGLGKGYVEYARRRWGLPIEPAQKADKLGRIKLVNGDLEHARIAIVGPMNEDLLEEMRTLPWADDTQQEMMPSMENHCCDGLIYGHGAALHFRATDREELPAPGTPEALEREMTLAKRQAMREAAKAARKKFGLG